MKLSEHFRSSEFTCKCGCGFNTVDENLIFVLECLREYFSQPVIINSGCRCDYWNAHENGSKNSQHLLGKAADIIINGVYPSAVYNILDTWFPGSCGIGKYYTFTHFDVREKRARW